MVWGWWSERMVQIRVVAFGLRWMGAGAVVLDYGRKRW